MSLRGLHVVGARRMSYAEIRDVAVRAGFPDPDLATAVALAESGGDPGVVGDLNLGVSIGLWQINVKAHPALAAQGDLHNPDYNALAAMSVSASGTNWKPWTTYRTGAYKQYLGKAAGAVSAIASGGAVWPLVLVGGLLWLAFRKPRRRYAPA